MLCYLPFIISTFLYLPRYNPITDGNICIFPGIFWDLHVTSEVNVHRTLEWGRWRCERRVGGRVGG